ncbi:EAL domain-containing response regulator [Hydrogenimonas sp.]
MDFDFSSLSDIHILYVEDEITVREEVVENISPFVKKITVAENGEEGLGLFQKVEDIDLILTDIMMPKMNGIEMVDAIRKIDPFVPVIYATAFDDNELLQRTIRQGISGFVLKPIDIEDLLGSLVRASTLIENNILKQKLQDYVIHLEEEVKKKTDALEAAYTTDALTGLPNRVALHEALQKSKNPIVAILDIDDFRTINDLYDIEIGNRVLKKFADMIKGICEDSSVHFFRSGSDDFVFLKEIEEKENCIRQISKFLERINSMDIVLEDLDIEIPLRVTCGAAFGKDNVLEKADMALKMAVDKHRTCAVYEESGSTKREYANHMALIHLLKTALSNDWIVPFFQPIVDAEGKRVGQEALIRIVEKEGRIHSPAEFLDISHKARLYTKLSFKMLEKSLESKIPINGYLSVNLSYMDIVDEEQRERIASLLKQSDIKDRIVFEITEDESIKDFETVRQFVERVHSFGAKIAIDDFGSGYSNFVYLLELNPDFIKIDGSIVKSLDTDKDARVICRTIVSFCKELGITTVAEYIHSESVFKVAKSLGVDRFQGYYFGEPRRIEI